LHGVTVNLVINLVHRIHSWSCSILPGEVCADLSLSAATKSKEKSNAQNQTPDAVMQRS